MPWPKGRMGYWTGRSRDKETNKKIQEKLRKLYDSPEKHPQYIGKINRSGYWYIKTKNHPCAGKQGYVAEHRLVIEQSIGRCLTKEEAVHHINGDPTDNRLENLELFSTHGEHTKVAHGYIFKWQKEAFKGKHFSLDTEWKKGDPRLIGNKFNRHSR